ncbi:Transcriptional regulatory protein ZraR [Rubripirellula lacrimiformis]|uniref:Transcriptional regulatory protein ZraR n=1 Tax=Rubripirellula lacrimiformis TaxID=1930273 RepID=A0A517NE78_9BACT|nr:sigma 54-interacting transcriptional regulator [Rubripirellula lacrimiformis]QDT05368.1 Transcriptional regulatory protein ZraR [Rubripirellula lacrimiformis]
MNTPTPQPLKPNQPSKPGRSVQPDRGGAYLVLRSAGRWSDVFRLSTPAEAIIGRSSKNQIVLKSDQASRQHARIRWGSESGETSVGGWYVEDMGSRNGTFVNGKRIEGAVRLARNDEISVAGFAITFTDRIDGAGGGLAPVSGPAHATDDQLTTELDPASITDRRRESAYLHADPAENPFSEPGPQSSRSLPLLQLAFTLARENETDATIEQVLDTIAANVEIDTAGVYLATKPPSSGGELPLVATRQTGPRSYRRPPEQLMQSVASVDGQATLARNVLGDGQLATENSRGEIDIESLILAPIRRHDGSLHGMLHLTTAAGGRPLSSSDLEFTVAASEILAEALASQVERLEMDRALHRSRRKVQQLQSQLGSKVQIVGRSEPIAAVIEQIGLAAPTGTTVLVRGESGVGKELVASALHHASNRRDGPLVCLNCAALSPSLLESELFGHEKGAFTGATDQKRGKFEVADGGTLMLDEIGEMSPEVQAKFLRVLEGHPFERVGGHQSIRVDVRVVAATNRDLQSMVSKGLFRQDLYYRLNVVEIIVPPLRDRGSDVLLLAEHFLHRLNLEMGRKIESISSGAKKRLAAYSWPGNIRELKNVIERAVVLNRKTIIDESDLALSPATDQSVPQDESTAPLSTLAELERGHIERILRHTDGNKSRAAQILGIERSTLDRKLKKYVRENG